MIAYAYDDRWSRMGQWEFYKRRLIRLQPMVVLGSVFGGALFYLQAGGLFPRIAETPVWQSAGDAARLYAACRCRRRSIFAAGMKSIR